MTLLNPRRLWRDTLTDDSGKFWRWARLRAHPGQYPCQADDLLTSRVLYIVPEIWISYSTSLGLLESLLQVISEGKTPLIRKLDCFVELAPQVSPEVLAGAAMKLESLRSEMSSPQLEAILVRIIGSPESKLRKIACWWSGPDMSGMDPEILSEALVNLETVDVGDLRLSPGQVLSLFSRIRDSPNLRLTQLSLLCNVSMVPPEVFVGAVSRLERVQFYRRAVTVGQLEALLIHQSGVGEPKLSFQLSETAFI